MLYCILVASIVCISFGQILFKKTALTMKAMTRPWYIIVDPYFIGALVIYGGATLVWIYVLQHLPLSRAYTIMSVGFILVPVLSYYFFQEPLTVKFFMGSLLIMAGVILTQT